jgi:hypothetical protein
MTFPRTPRHYLRAAFNSFASEAFFRNKVNLHRLRGQGGEGTWG